MNKAIMFGALALALGVSACCKKPTESSSGADPAATAESTASATAAPTAALPEKGKSRVYEMDKPGDGTETYIRIKRVTVSSENTVMNMSITNEGKRTMSISTSPPGQITTFYIQSQSHDRRFALLRSEGLAVSPKRQNLAPGKTVEFTLVFAPLDPDVTVFDVYEGDKKSQKGGTTYWNFSDVTLK